MARKNSAAEKTAATAAKTASTAELAKGVQKVLADASNPPQGGAEGQNDKPEIKLMTEAQQAQVKAMLKDGKVVSKLDDADAKFCDTSMSETLDEVWRKGGYLDAVAALQASQNKLSKIQYNLCMRTELRHEGEGIKVTALRVAYFDAMFKRLEEDAKKHDRLERAHRNKNDPKADLGSELSVEELLGKHWTQNKSKLRRSMLAGLLPSKFSNASAFCNAMKQSRKTGGTQNQTTKHGGKGDVAEQFAQLAKDANYGDLTALSLGKLVVALRKVDFGPSAHDIAIAQILTNATQAVMALASGAEQAVEPDTKAA